MTIPTENPTRRGLLLSAALAAVSATPALSQDNDKAQLEANKAVVRQMIDRVQGGGDFEFFERVFAADYVDHTPFGGFAPDRNGTRSIYQTFRKAFPDWHAVVHFQVAEGDLVTSHKTYHGTHRGEFSGIAATGRRVAFGVVDVMRVRNGRITDHWGYADAAGLMNQLKS